MDTRESLAKELAQERLNVAIEIACQGGIQISTNIDDYMKEAYEFVDRCIQSVFDNSGY